jgi:glycosyltransferase involved in cell wall biosynthesis
MTTRTLNPPTVEENGRASDLGSKATKPIRVAMILAGIGRVRRGAEAAFLEIAKQLARTSDIRPVLFGSGDQGLPDVPAHVIPCRPREKFERWPRLPTLRSDCYYEELSYTINLARSRLYRPSDFDVVVSCSYPWVNWYLRMAGRGGGPAHVYVTENGDWPCQASSREYRFFRCDGLVCTNPIYFERNRTSYPTKLIPNGVDPDVFRPASDGERETPAEFSGLGISPKHRVVVMASAMIPSKDVAGGVRAAARIPDAFLLIAGDGPERASVAALAAELLPGRHALLGSIRRELMPQLFRQADVFLHMSRDEPSALVYLEAAATGLPLVVHDNTITRWTLGDAALYADTAEVDLVAGELDRALEPGRAAELGAAARRRVLDGWTWEVLAGRYREFFLELTSPERRSTTAP